MRKRHRSFLTLSAVLLLAAAGRAQTGTLTTVQSSPDGPWFYVDGTVFYHAMSAFWPVGSSHTISVASGTGYNYTDNGTVQNQFQQWQWQGGTSASTMLQVIASPSITSYTAQYSTLYLVSVQTVCNPAPCTGVPGAAMANGSIGAQPAWMAPGSSLSLMASSNPGWIFAGWQVGANPLIATVTATVPVNGPTTVNAVFVPAKTVSFVTNPPNLQIYADGALMSTPRTLQWGLGTSHTLGGIDVQFDINAKRWVFASWSDGGAETHAYVVGKNLSPETVTANYAAAATPFFLTSPSNLDLVVDGKTLPPPYSYIWGVGSTHQVTATSPQTDAQGNVWVFQSWDDLVTAATRTITIPVGADVNGYRLTALYAQQVRLTIGSTLAGQAVTVDGSRCTTPCTVARNMGTQVRVSAPASVPVSRTSREDFLGWSTGGGVPAPGDWVATLNAPSTSITATYRLMHSLTAGPNPTGDAPHSAVAQLTAVPYIAPNGVSNGAGTAPQPGVAPGSVASIFGANLAAATAVGPASPLVQTLAGVTVHIGDRLLPLYFASPEQINLQIPPDLAPGAQTITVSAPGMPDINSDFTVVRDAPGLFPVVLDGQTYALVLHQDGTLVTAAAPAQQGELLTAYGTGFGPTDHPRREGIAALLTPPYNMILDPVTVQVGSSVFTPQSAFAAPGQVGIDLVQFRLDGTAPSGAAIPLYVTVNGVSSNTLPLPIQ